MAATETVTITTTTTTTTTTTKTKQIVKKAPQDEDIFTINIIRVLLLCFIYLVYRETDVIQQHIDILWEWLRDQWWYQTVYSETLMAQVYAFPAVCPYMMLYLTGWGRKYKIDQCGGGYVQYTYKLMVMEHVDYTWPLFILDTFHVKVYAGVTDAAIAERRRHWIQRTRALPESPPLLGDMIRHLVIALVVYDALFFLQHFIFHKNATLYRLFHYKHHEHNTVNVKVTNTLHTVERILLVLSANFGLKIQGAHPMTRTLFIFIFLAILYNNHCGYDFPYSYEKIIPWGIIGGSLRHYAHHEYGSRNYQPIFTYLDTILEWMRKRRRVKTNRRSST